MTDKMRDDAIREAARNHAGDEYFNADRAYLLVSPYSGRIFDAGFDRGWQAAQAVPVVGEVVAYLHADKGGKVLWSESCVCEDAVWPHIDDDDTDQSLPVYRQPTHSITAAELERMQKDAERYAVVRDSTYCDVYMHEIYLTDDDLDAAIDAAIAAEGTSNG